MSLDRRKRRRQIPQTKLCLCGIFRKANEKRRLHAMMYVQSVSISSIRTGRPIQYSNNGSYNLGLLFSTSRLRPSRQCEWDRKRKPGHNIQPSSIGSERMDSISSSARVHRLMHFEAQTRKADGETNLFILRLCGVIGKCTSVAPKTFLSRYNALPAL